MKTIENPEIIDISPGPERVGLTWRERPRRVVNLMLWMLFAALPALLLDRACGYLYAQTETDLAGLAWLMLMVLIFPALVATFITALVELVLFGALLATCFGKPIVVTNLAQNMKRTRAMKTVK